MTPNGQCLRNGHLDLFFLTLDLPWMIVNVGFSCKNKNLGFYKGHYNPKQKSYAPIMELTN